MTSPFSPRTVTRLLWLRLGTGERRPGRVESKVIEDPPRDGRLGDEGDELHAAAALVAGEDVEREHLLEQVSPRDPVGPGRFLCWLLLAPWLLRSVWRRGLRRCELQADARLREQARRAAERAIRGLLLDLGFHEVHFVEQLPALAGA